ncbi:hypothetical protein Metal_2653 [Methylomicrobium album BG8]|uniref:Uncharacterized protein n=1 Tax=Methylomicrobium album BG8 TaxID=686340 RepID=H8GJK3_METAL|nr:hypothetical protein Metal_2653 [Methylomicrobium album BG8]
MRVVLLKQLDPEEALASVATHGAVAESRNPGGLAFIPPCHLDLGNPCLDLTAWHLSEGEDFPTRDMKML